MELRRAKEERKLNRRDSTVLRPSQSVENKQPRLNQMLLKMNQACYYRMHEYEVFILLSEVLCRGQVLLSSHELSDLTYFRGVGVKQAWRLQNARVR